MTDDVDVQKLIMNTVSDIFSSLMKSIFYEITVNGDLQSNKRGYEFKIKDDCYRVILEVEKNGGRED